MTSSNGSIFRITGHCYGEFTGPRWIPRTPRPVTRSFDVFFDLRLNKRLSKQSWGWWFEAPSRSLWRNCNDISYESLKQLRFEPKCSQIGSHIIAKGSLWMFLKYQPHLLRSCQRHICMTYHSYIGLMTISFIGDIKFYMVDDKVWATSHTADD